MIILEFNNLFFNEFNYIGFFVQRASTETEFQTHNIKQTNNCHIKTGISHRHIRYSFLFSLSFNILTLDKWMKINDWAAGRNRINLNMRKSSNWP